MEIFEVFARTVSPSAKLGPLLERLIETFRFGSIASFFTGLANTEPSSVIFKTSRTVTGGRLPGAETRLRPAKEIDPSATSCLKYCFNAILCAPLMLKAHAISRRPTEPLEFSINSLIWSAFGSPDTFLILRATTLVWSLNVFVKI